MTALILALALALQGQSQPSPERPLQAENSGWREITPAHDTYEEEFGATDAQARIAIQGFGGCVARRSSGTASEILTRDFTTREYQQGLRVLSRNNEDCFRRRGRMRSHNLLFAGAIAEHLVEQGQEPLNVRLARAASLPPPGAFSQTDRVALCVVRSLPDDVARLFATEIASESEQAAASSLNPAVSQCNGEARPLSISTAGLRAILATAAFRTLNAAARPTQARN